MQEIGRDILIETDYPGVTLGAVKIPPGLLLIDAPPRLEDARAWRAALQNLGGSGERLLVNLDSHYDRTLGVRAMDCPIIAHENTAEIFRTRSATFKAQEGETGAEWEQMGGLGSVRWAPPDLTFTTGLSLHWGEHPIHLVHRPGPNPGAVWVVFPEDRVMFIGDLVTPNQPPFLENADLDAWIDALEQLLGQGYSGYLLVSGRGGTVTTRNVREQADFLSLVRASLTELGSHPNPAAVESSVAALLAGLKHPAARREQYAQRLRWGINHLVNHQNQAENPPAKTEA